MFARNRLRRVTAVVAIAGLLNSSTPPGTACGPWFPRQYLAQGGLSLLETPRSFAEIELKLLARGFPVPFRAVRDEFPQRRMREHDVEDFDAAIRAGAIRPPDPAAARLAHRRMREAIQQYADLTKAERADLQQMSWMRRGRGSFQASLPITMRAFSRIPQASTPLLVRPGSVCSRGPTASGATARCRLRS